MSIENYGFSDSDVFALNYKDGIYLYDEHIDGNISINKNDSIALAKHFKLTAHDIECTEYQALCADLNQVDEDYFDELVEIQAHKIKINKSIN